MDNTTAQQPLCEKRRTMSQAARAGVPGSDAIQGVIDRWQRQNAAQEEWDDWLDSDEHADSDADDDGE